MDTKRVGFDNLIYQITNFGAFDLLFLQIRGQMLLLLVFNLLKIEEITARGMCCSDRVMLVNPFSKSFYCSLLFLSVIIQPCAQCGSSREVSPSELPGAAQRLIVVLATSSFGLYVSVSYFTALTPALGPSRSILHFHSLFISASLCCLQCISSSSFLPVWSHANLLLLYFPAPWESTALCSPAREE